MTAKEIFRAVIRTTTLITLFIVLFGVIGFLYEWVEAEVTLGKTIFWGVTCFLTAFKISFIKEDF